MGGGETIEHDQMPVEECGNMLILTGALCEFSNDLAFIRNYWKSLTLWAEYLESKGFDPDNQLCTDDFAGHLAHNTNLSIKAILALGSYAQMAQKLGYFESAQKYESIAKNFAQKWEKEAYAKDHYKLAFDRDDSWSMKYNLIWDKLLNLNYFPEHMAQTELAYYRKVQNKYGLPLDNRSDYTKIDWAIWTASLTGDKEDFKDILDPIFECINTTPDRVALSDWLYTSNAKLVAFKARSVVGGLFITMLQNPVIRNKWLSKNTPS